MHVTYQVYTFINIINLSIQIYPYRTKLDLPRVHLNSRLARLMLFISVPFRPFPPFFYRLNGQPFNFRLPPKQNSLPPFTIYWPFKRPFNPFRRTLADCPSRGWTWRASRPNSSPCTCSFDRTYKFNVRKSFISDIVLNIIPLLRISFPWSYNDFLHIWRPVSQTVISVMLTSL